MAKEYSVYKASSKLRKAKDYYVSRPTKNNGIVTLYNSSYLFLYSVPLKLNIVELSLNKLEESKQVTSVMLMKSPIGLPDVGSLNIITTVKHSNIFEFKDSFHQRLRNQNISLADDTLLTENYDYVNDEYHTIFKSDFYTEGKYGNTKLFDKDESVIEFYILEEKENFNMLTDIYVSSEVLFDKLFEEV